MLELVDISKVFPGFNLENISFSVEQGDYCVILGPSGAGKTVLLEILAGLVIPDRGKVSVDGEEVTHHRIQARPFGLVFQDHAVFPHLKVWQNIAYPLKARGRSKAEIKVKVVEIASVCGIAHLLDRYPSKLSGGELQRVAVARTLLARPRYLLLDEPLSSLDISLRAELQRLLRNLNRNGQTIIHVTHDFDEALVLANKIVVISNGRVIQSGSPEEVFHHPSSAFMARFTGVKNYFEAVIAEIDGKSYARTKSGQDFRIMTDLAPGAKGYVMVRGEDIILSLAPLSSSATNQFRGEIKDISLAVRGYEVRVDSGGLEFFVNTTEESPGKLGLQVNKEVWISFKATATRFIPMD